MLHDIRLAFYQFTDDAPYFGDIMGIVAFAVMLLTIRFMPRWA